jgi:hypothetical protein
LQLTSSVNVIYTYSSDILEQKKNYQEARKTIAAATASLQHTKPDHAESSIKEYESRMKDWPK